MSEARQSAAQRRVQAAARMRLRSYDWETIAEVVGYVSAARARAQVERFLGATVGEADRARLRELSTAQVELLLRHILPKALDEEASDQLAAAGMALRLIEKRDRLHGTDAPVVTQLQSPALDRFNELINEAVALRDGHPAVEEHDVVTGGAIAPVFDRDGLAHRGQRADQPAIEGGDRPFPEEAGLPDDLGVHPVVDGD